jgi:5'(3')-deoxyribonucleotidase
MIFYMDLDEVFSDFVGAICRIHHLDKLAVISYARENKQWSITPALTHLLCREITEKEMWAPVLENELEFWLSLRPLPWALQLLDYLDKSGLEWYLVSAPYNSTACHEGKIKWIHAFFGEHFDRFILTPYKFLLAKPNTMLIDDSPKNIEQFRINGGQAHLFGNSTVASAEAFWDPMKDLEKQLNQFRS